MSGLSHCVECGRRLHNAFFCPQCSQPACSWGCFQQHRSRHTAPSDPVREEGPPPRTNGDRPGPREGPSRQEWRSPKRWAW
jgi:hypothetical protein